MPDRFTSLTCPNCGGKLDVYDDMERFACGYCGKEVAAEWRGGTVALKGITESIQHLRAGAERTAAELALTRLGRELSDLNDHLSGLRAKAARLPKPPREQVPAGPEPFPWMSIAILAVFGTVALFLAAGTFGLLATAIGAALVVIVLAASVAARKRARRKQLEAAQAAVEGSKNAARALNAEMDAVARDIADREREIAYQKGIVSVPQAAELVQ